MENHLQKLVNILSQKFSTSLIVENKKSDINFKFQTPLQLDPNFNYELALVYFSTYNSIFNVTNKNNKIIIKIITNQKTIPIELPPGAYEINEISSIIGNILKVDKTLIPLKDKEFYIIIKPNPISLNCIMQISKNCEVQFPKENSLANMLGFETEKIYSEGNHSSKSVAISNINRIMIECNIVEGAFYNGEKTNIIFDFPSNTVRKGSRIIERPKFPIYYPLITKKINEINFKIIDNKGELIDFNEEEISFTIHLKQV